MPVYLPAKLAMQKTAVALSPENTLNMVLVSPKLSSRLLQFTSSQVVLLLQAKYADLAYHCANPSCDNFCHLAATCSGFVNPRRNARALSSTLFNTSKWAPTNST